MFDTEVKHPRPADARRGEPRGSREAVADSVEHRLFALAVAPWLTPATRAIEIGPGGGRWSVRLAPLVGELVVVDVADAMLERTRARLRAAGITNVSFVQSAGQDPVPLAAGRFDLVFGCDVFVQIPHEAALRYLGDIARVLRTGGVAVLHHAPSQFHSRDAFDRMYGRFGLRIESVWTDDDTTVVTARKPAGS